MIILTKISNYQCGEYAFIERLLVDSFPREEYRDLGEQRNNTCSNKLFNLMLIKDEEQPIGFISFWEFNRFRYVEHFAIQAQMRNKKYGRQVMEILQQSSLAIVLETEEPENETAARRIDFYRRLGFVTSDKTYMQPPYRSDGENIKMRLMFWGKINAESNFEEVRDIIYKNVYQHSTN